MTAPTNAPVAILYPTVQDGTVVRWYRSVDEAKYGSEIASASRDRVCIEGASQKVAARAYAVHEVLRSDRRADVSFVATHRRVTSGLGVELVELEHPADEMLLDLLVDLPLLVELPVGWQDQVDQCCIGAPSVAAQLRSLLESWQVPDA